MATLPERPRHTRILSIDGGGIRGLIPAQVLAFLEEKLKARLGEDARIADVFDLVAGTSTGGILSCIYLCPDDPRGASPRPRFAAKDATDLYMKWGGDIFRIPPLHWVRSLRGLRDERYPADGLERALSHYLRDLRMSDLLKPCLITAYDIERRKALFFRQHDTKDGDRDVLVRHAARATSAAPTYFEAARVGSGGSEAWHLIDGGVFANNPTLCAYADARSKLPGAPKAADMVILSLGTGRCTTPYEYEKAKDWGPIGWVRPLIDIMMSGVAETVDYQLRQIYEAVDKPDQYLRLDVELPEALRELDDAAPEKLRALRQRGEALAEAQAEKLDRFVDLLLA